MTAYSNTAEGGSDSVTVTTGNSGGASGTAWSSVTGTTTFTTSDAFAGSVCYSGDPTSPNAAYCSWAGLGGDELYSEIAFKINSAMPTSYTAVFRIDTTPSTYYPSIRIYSDGSFKFYIATSGRDASSTGLITYDTWYRLKIYFNSTTGAYTVTLLDASGVEIETISGTDTYLDNVTTFDEVKYGIPNRATSFTGETYLWDNAYLSTDGYSDTTYPVTKTLATSWNVRKAITKTSATSWNVRKAISKTLATSWNVRKAVTKTVSTTWNVASDKVSVTKTLATSWNVREAVTKTISTTWNVAASLVGVEKTASTSWNVRKAIIKTLATSWNVREAVTKVRATTWDVASPFADSTITLVSPVDAETPSLTPVFMFTMETDLTGAITGQLQVSTDNAFASEETWSPLSFTPVFRLGEAPERVQAGGNLVDDTTYYWRVRLSDGSVYSNWSDTEQFSVNTSLGNAYEYGYFGDVEADTPTPHLWFIRPASVTQGDVATVYGHGFGSSGNVILDGDTITPDSWTTVSAGSDAYTGDREIDSITGTVDPEHDEVVFTVPSDTVAPGAQLYIEGS